MSTAAVAQEGSEQTLAKQLANPASALISVPFQHTYDCCYGESAAGRYTLNIQPVIPFSLGDDWTLITRTILPIIDQASPAPFSDDAFGLGDVQQSFFFKPNNLPEGWTIAAGPIVQYPTATEDTLGQGKLGLGPTALAIRQHGGWTYGVLANHVWSIAGSGNREEVDRTFVQPILNYTFPNTVALSLNAEASYDWVFEETTIPIDAGISKIFKFGRQPVSIGVQARYYVTAPDGGPEWGLRFTTTFLFPGGMRQPAFANTR